MSDRAEKMRLTHQSADKQVSLAATVLFECSFSSVTCVYYMCLNLNLSDKQICRGRETWTKVNIACQGVKQKERSGSS